MKKRKIIKDNRGQWAHPGKITQINSNNITMQGVDYPVLGVSDTGDTKLMLPGQDYKFNGNKVTEFPMKKKAQQGTVIPLDIQKTNLMLKNALQIERNQKRESARTAFRKQYPLEKFPGRVNKEMIKYYRNEPQEYSTLDINLLDEKRKQSLLKTYKPLISMKKGGKIKAQDGFSASDINPEGMIDLDSTGTDTSNIYGQFSDQYQGINTAAPVQQANNNPRNWGMIMQGISAVGNSFSSTGNGNGPTEGQKIVGQFGPWGAAISAVSQIGTRIGDEVGGKGGSILSSMASPSGALTNKDFSTEDKIKGAINPIYAGLRNHEIKQKKKEKERKLNELVQKASSLQDPDANKRKYVRPEDQLIDPNQMFPTYGVGTTYLKNGGTVPHMGKTGELETYSGGKAEPLSYNPFLPGVGETIEFKGNSHEQGGIQMKFGKTPVEVEGGEPAIKMRDGGNQSLTVFGNMKIPSYGVSELNDPKAKGKKFKNYIKDLSKDENKQNEIVDKGMKLINDTPVLDNFDKLTMASGKAMVEGGNMKLKQIAKKKEMASIIQNAILDTASELGLKSDDLAKGNIKKARNGAKVYQDGGTLTIPRSKMDEYKQYGYLPDPEDVNRMYRDIYSSGANTTIPVNPPSKGSEEFNKAFGDARRKGLSEFTFKGKPYTTDLYQGSNKTVTTPGRTVRDYVYLQDDPNVPATVDIPGATQSTSMVNETIQLPKQRFPWEALANSILPFFRPTDQMGLDPNQLRGEMYALANNQVEPVAAQLYQPLLENVSDISLQDQMNANQADFNAISRTLDSNPAAQSALAAQKYRANSSVLGEQFRQNQGQKMNIFNRNRGVLNDTTLKNLSILDQQYVRQSQARSNTKAVAQAAISSISDKIAKNKLENRTLGVYENLYNYRFDNSGRAINYNGFVDFTSMIENAVSNGALTVDQNGKVVVNEQKVKRDELGAVTGSTETHRVTDLPPGYRTSGRTRENGGVVRAMKSY